METVMSVGLRLCALEFTREQLQTLSYLAVTGLLPDSFPRAMWVQFFFTMDDTSISPMSSADALRTLRT